MVQFLMFKLSVEIDILIEMPDNCTSL